MDYALSEHYDSIILDIMMLKKNGLELLQSLKANVIISARRNGGYTLEVIA